jgi:hypothetical protein
LGSGRLTARLVFAVAVFGFAFAAVAFAGAFFCGFVCFADGFFVAVFLATGFFFAVAMILLSSAILRIAFYF